MYNSNLLFQLTVEWRYWQGQRAKLLFLMLSFALVVALVTLVLHLGKALFDAPPSWSKPYGKLYTLANQHSDGRLSPIHLQAIEAAAKTTGVINHTWFSFQSNNFTLLNNADEPLNVLFYAENLPSALGIAELTTTEKGVWLSERYWLTQADHRLLDTEAYLYHPRFPQPLKILGVLPRQLNRIGPFQPDIWLPNALQQHLTPFTSGAELMRDRFLRAAPFHYGILLTKDKLAATELTTYLRSLDLTVPSMRMGSDGADLVVFEGLTLDPIARENLKQQWQLALVLIISLIVALGFNTLSIYSNRLLKIQENYRIQQTLGANVLNLLYGPLAFCVLIIFCLAIASLGALLLLYNLLAHIESYLVLFGETGLKLDMLSWLAALIIASALFVFCACLPTLRFNQQRLFSRQVGPSLSFLQKSLAQINLTSQLCIALVLLGFLLNLSWQQWQQFRAYQLANNIMYMHVKQKGTGIDVSALIHNRLANVDAADIAFSFTPFDSQQSVELKDARLANPLAVELRVVSSNYFERLGVTMLEGHAEWHDGVMLNKSLAQIFRQSTDHQLLGSQLDLDNLLGSQVIKGIVDDLPHRGRSQRTTPAIYINVNSAPVWTAMSKQIEFYFPETALNQAKNSLVNWLEQQLESPEFTEPQELSQLIAKHDETSRLLLSFSVVMIMIVLCTLFFSLAHQVKNRILLERYEYGVLLAMGCEDWRLIFRAARQSLLGALLGIPIALALLLWLLSSVGWLSAFKITPEPMLMLLAACLIVLLVVLAAIPPVLSLLRRQIYPLLRTL